MTTDKGVFKPIGNTQVGLAGRAISHTNNATRKWSFRFRSDQTGLANWHAVGNTVNGDFRDKDDSWGFYGPNPSLPGAAFHVFVNDDQVFPYGKSCAGSHGYTPLIGAATNARRGQTFPVELYDVPPQTAAIGIFGFSNKSFGAFQLPLSLAPFGAPGCDLNASMELLMPVPTTGSGNGGGKAVFNWVIPNIPALRGQNIYLSALVADAGANRLGIASGMGLRAVIQ